MGKIIAKKFSRMSWKTKIGIVFTLLTGIFLYQGVIKPLIGVTATNTYYFTRDSSAVNLGADGSTNTSSTLGGKISMIKGTPYTSSRSVTASSNTSEQTMMRAYGPVYSTTQTLTAPAVTIGVRDRNGTNNNINWKAYVYAYNPSGSANNGTLLWTSNSMEAHPSVQTPLEFTFTNPAPKDIPAGQRVKVVITCQMASTSSSARFYWGNSSNYAFFTVSEAPYVANSLTVNNLSDYYNGQLATVTQGDSNVPMFQFDMYSNVSGGATWSGGKLDKIGTNTSLYVNDDEPGDVSFTIYKDTDGDGLFKSSDTAVGGPYDFTQLTAQTYTLATPQTITSTPVRYFIVFNIRRNAAYNTTAGARITGSSYFTVTGASGGVTNVTSTSSSTPNIQFGGVAVTKNYPADWDLGTSLIGISETGAESITDSTCVTRNTAGSNFPLTGLLNYPIHSCTSVAGQGYSTTTAQSDFIRLYFGGSGYKSIMKTIKGGSFVYRLYTPNGGGTVTFRLFYVTSGGVRVNSPIASTYTTGNSISQTITTSLAGQDFSNVPLGARLGIQIGVTANCRIGLGSSVGAQLTVQETAAENENVDVGNGSTVANANVYASSADKEINSFTLTAAKPKTVTAITVTGSSMFNSTNIKNVKLYADTGTLGVLDGEAPLGSTTTISGNSATISGLSLAVSTGIKRFLVSVSINDTPNTNVILTALVSDVTVATTGTVGVNSDSASGTLTILPTTTLSDFITSEPPVVIIPSGAGATKVDAFAIKTNGGVNDTISNITISLSSTSTLPAGKLISAYVSRVDILNSSGSSLGHLTAPTQLDNWQISTTGLAATQTNTEYFVAITPKPNQNITLNVKGRVTTLSHSRTTNNLIVNDTGSSSIIIDQLPPTEPTLSAVTGTYNNDTDRAEINLNWIGSTDASGSAVSYILVRGLGNAPAPRTCTADGVKTFAVYAGSALSYTNKGLDEGVSYGYRVCAKDSVGNISDGSTKSTTASIKNRCTEIPELVIDPMNSHVKAGNSVSLAVGITNKNTGVCPATTFTLSIVGPGTDVADSNFTASSFVDGLSYVIPTNRGSKYTHLLITAKPGAAEKAVKTFHVKVTKSTDLNSTTCVDPVYVVVNKFGAMTHSSLQLGTKYGSWGVDYNCSTCHNPNSSNIKQIKDVIQTPTGNRSVKFSIISTGINANVAGVFGNDNRTGTASSNVCEVCHHNTRFHQYSSNKIAWKNHNNNGDCMECHPHSLGFKAAPIVGSCDDCHGDPPTVEAELVVPPTNVLFPYATNAGSHAKHKSRQLACQTCHSNANHTSSAIPDKKLNMGFSIKGTNFTGFVGNISSGKLRSLPPGNDYTYQGAPGTTIEQAPATIMTCNVYCHGWEGNGGYNSEPAWTGITQVGCGSCHAASNDDPPTSGSHHKHASSEPGFGNGIACGKCHGMRNYSSSSAHINGNVEWDLSTITTSAAYKGANKGSTGAKAPTTPGSYGSCTNLYCHSNVVTPNNNGVGAPTVFSNPTWGGTTTCNSCHQAQPNMTGGHPQHAGSGVTGFDCRICHGSGGDANPLNHANDRIDFKFEGLGENTHYSYSSSKVTGSGVYGSCYNSNCHGSRRAKADLKWGAETALPLCDKCHGSASSAGGFYSTAGPNSTRSNTDPYVGAHFRHITSAAPYKYSAKVLCSSCHYNPSGPYSPGHMDTPLPAEVNFGSLAASGLQGTFTSAAHQPTYNYGPKSCNNLWCHGSGMDSNEGTGAYGSIGPIGQGYDGGTLGSPAPAVWNAPFLTGVGTNDCIKCHSYPPPAPESGYTHWDDNNNRPYIANQCILCHKHVDSTGYNFTKPALHVNGTVDSCNTCHGRPPIDEKGLTNPAIGALAAGFVGAHQAHFLNPSIKSDCGVCHYNYNQEMPSYQLEIGFNAYGGKVVSGTFYGYSTLLANNYTPKITYKSTNAGTVVRRTNSASSVNTCSSLYCHGGGTSTLAALGGGTNVKPSWEGGSSQAACGSCHGVTGDTYKTRGSHGVHVGNGYGMLGLACSNCHGIKENNYHVDGKVEWEFYSTAKRLNLAVTNPAYTPASGNGTAGVKGSTLNLAPSASFGTCAVYCHSDGRGNFASPLPVWGGPPLNCGSCHINQTSTFNGSHEKHSKSSALGGYGIECTICHLGSGFASSRHVNGTIEVIFDTSVVGPSATFNSVGKTCFNILCHVTTATTGPTWGVPSTGNYDTGTYKPTCIGCHSGEVGTRAAIIPQFTGQSHHIQGVTMSNSYCYPCHLEAADTNGTVNLSRHDRSANKPVDLVIWGPGSRTTGAGFITYSANGSAAGKRTQYAKLNSHCLGCHNLQNSTTTPINPFGDGKNPKSYAWDGLSIAERYTQGTTTTWGKVTTNNSAAKGTTNSTKAYSAHGQASLNKRGWNTTADNYINTSGTVNVVCFDCHNSHGTDATGIMSSYSSATGRYKGAILKSTTNGKGGYTADYTPLTGGDAAAPNKNAYNPGAALCFDCHNNATANSTIPWGYSGTFGASQAIYGYNDTPNFGNSTFAATQTYTYKANNGTNKGGHFGHYTTMTTAISKRSFDVTPQNGTTAINGLCTPCHDPHGVSPSLGANQQYAVPMLKGTWVTSPYKQDGAPANTNETRGGGSRKSALNVGSTPGYRIDQNTMGAASGTTAWTFPSTPNTLQSTTDTQFAGLCTGCHAKASINNTAAVTSAAGSTGSWKSVTRIHNAVKGWAVTTGTGGNKSNAAHAYTCSKCHTPHNSQLPRLLVTNCLDIKHRGRAASGGSMSAPQAQSSGSSGAGTGRFPQGGGGTGSRPKSTAGQWFFGKGVESKVTATQSQTLCHESTTAGGTYNSGTEQLWNTKSPW